MKILCIFSFMSGLILIMLGINLNINSNSNKYLSLEKIEALADSPEDKEAIYNKNKGDCEKEFTVDGDGYIEIFGKRMKVAGAGVGGTYHSKYTDVQIDCPKGTEYYECKECSCANFWEGNCN